MDLKAINEVIEYAAKKHGREVLPATAAYLEVEISPTTGREVRRLNLVGTDAALYARIARHLRKRLDVDYIHTVKPESVRAEWKLCPDA